MQSKVRPRRPGLVTAFLSVSALSLAVMAGLPAGCASDYASHDPYLTADLSPERLREIGALDHEGLNRFQTAGTVDPQDVDEPQTADEVERLLHRTGSDGEPPERIELTIEQCRADALANNLDLQVSLLGPAIARQSVSEEEARFEALFYANADLTKTDTPTASTLSGSQVESQSGDFGVRLPLRTGGSLSFDFPVNRFETNNAFSTLNPSYTSDFRLSLSQPLLRGAGVRTNEHAIRLARYQEKASEVRAKLEVTRVLAAVDRMYWLLYASRRALEVRKQEYDLAVAQLERAQRQVAVGEAAEVEIIRAEAGVAERVEAIIIADNQVRDRERDLKRLLNAPRLGMETPTIIVPATEPNPVHYRLDPDPLIEVAMTQRMELLEIELQLAQDASSIDSARNQALPFAAVDYTYNVNGLGGSWDDSLDLMFDKSFEDHRLGFRLEVPLGNEAAESRLRRAMFSRLQRLATRAARESQISKEVYAAVDQLEANWQRVVAAGRSAVLAARNLQAEQRQNEIGLRTSTDVLDAQARLADARLAEIRAVTEYQIAQIDVAYAVGLLIGASNVRWEPTEPE